MPVSCQGRAPQEVLAGPRARSPQKQQRSYDSDPLPPPMRPQPPSFKVAATLRIL